MRETLDAATVREWGERYSNGGRWGRDDLRGTLNFITPDRVRAACAIPRRGLVISCALPVERRAPRNAREEEAQPDANDADEVPGEECAAPTFALSTQWSARSGIFSADHGSEPRAADEAERRRGARPWRDPIQDGVVGRGVLLDLPRFLRRPWLDGGTRIMPNDLDNCAEALGIVVERGDIVLVRTGRLTRCFYEGSWEGYRGGPTPGLSAHCARWLHEREVAAVASDTWSVEVIPNESTEGEQPLHEVALGKMGLLFGETFHLDTLSEACAADGDYAFLFATPLLRPPGASGRSINPLAIK